MDIDVSLNKWKPITPELYVRALCELAGSVEGEIKLVKQELDSENFVVAVCSTEPELLTMFVKRAGVSPKVMAFAAIKPLVQVEPELLEDKGEL